MPAHRSSAGVRYMFNQQNGDRLGVLSAHISRRVLNLLLPQFPIHSFMIHIIQLVSAFQSGGLEFYPSSFIHPAFRVNSVIRIPLHSSTYPT